MKKPHALIGLLAALGTAIGVIVAVVGLPYGRLNYTAFAGLYHNGGTPAVNVHVNVDCDTTTSGVQEDCNIPVSSVAAIPINVVVGNYSGVSHTFAGFNYDLYNPNTGAPANTAGVIGPNTPSRDATGLPAAGWNCTGSPPQADTGLGAPGTTTSFLSCIVQSGAPDTLNNATDTNIGNHSFSDGVTAPANITLVLSNVATADDNVIPLATCDPNNPPPADPSPPNTTGPCFTATLHFVVPPTATATPIPPTATDTPIPPTATNTPIPPTATATPAGAVQAKTCDPLLTATNYSVTANGPACNLFICQVGACAGPGEGDLVVIESVSNVDTAPIGPGGPGLGAYEFNVEFDNFVIQSVNPTDIVFSPGGAGATRGPATCTMAITLENSVRFGCVTTGPTPPGPEGSFQLAKLDLVPAADDLKDLFPGNDNGIPTLIKDNGCELADVFGHPVLGTGAGLLPVCGDLYVTVRILEGDLNLDCKVDVTDETIIATHYAAVFGSTFYDKWFDLEPRFHDLDIDIKDLQKVFGRDGSNCQTPVPAQTPVPPPFNLNS